MANRLSQRAGNCHHRWGNPPNDKFCQSPGCGTHRSTTRDARPEDALPGAAEGGSDSKHGPVITSQIP